MERNEELIEEFILIGALRFAIDCSTGYVENALYLGPQWSEMAEALVCEAYGYC
jgi:hypothetical protein